MRATYALDVRASLIVACCTLLVSESQPARGAPPGPPAVTHPSVDELQRAFARHDPVELERVATRLGAMALCNIVERGQAPARRAALVALELIDGWGGLPLFPRLVALADRSDTDAALALAIMSSVRRIAERVPRGELDLDELPGDLPRAAVDALAALAAREDRPAPLRIEATYALAALAPLVAGAAAKIAALVGTRDPEVRRALADALPASSSVALVRLLTDDGVAVVAAAAASSLCRDVPPPGGERKSDHRLQRAAELPVAARTRLRALAIDPTLLEADRLDVLPCLRAGAQRIDQQKADLEVLRTVARGPDGSLKRRARAYGGR